MRLHDALSPKGELWESQLNHNVLTRPVHLTERLILLNTVHGYPQFPEIGPCKAPTRLSDPHSVPHIFIRRSHSSFAKDIRADDCGW
jgi:hypothetical protein